MILIITLILSICFAIEIGNRYSNFFDQLKDVVEEVSKGTQVEIIPSIEKLRVVELVFRW